MAPNIPPFQDAVAQFRKFLKDQGHDGELMWLFREDVSVRRWGKIRIRMPLPETNTERAARIYAISRERGIGVLLDVFCLLNGSIGCFVWIPDDEEEAEEQTLSELKLRVPIKPLVASALEGSFWARVTHWVQRHQNESPTFDWLPRRADAEPGLTLSLDTSQTTQLKKTLASFVKGEGPDSFQLRRTAKQIKALPLFSDMGGCFLIRVTGEVISFAWGAEEERRGQPSSHRTDVALYAGSQQYPELSFLRPAQPADAVVCSYCDGTGVSSAAKQINVDIRCFCGGLGWHRPLGEGDAPP